jgi:excisionase family DNA binding protein
MYDDTEVLTATEAATLFGLTAPRLLTWAKQGDVPALRCGTDYRFGRTALAQILLSSAGEE